MLKVYGCVYLQCPLVIYSLPLPPVLSFGPHPMGMHLLYTHPTPLQGMFLLLPPSSSPLGMCLVPPPPPPWHVFSVPPPPPPWHVFTPPTPSWACTTPDTTKQWTHVTFFRVFIVVFCVSQICSNNTTQRSRILLQNTRKKWSRWKRITMERYTGLTRPWRR